MGDKTVYISASASGTGDYSCMASCIAGELIANADITAAGMNGILNMVIIGDWDGEPDVAAVTIDGFTTDSTHYINIYTDSTNMATSGGLDTTKYFYDVPAGQALNVNDGHVRFNGVQLRLNTLNNYQYAFALNDSIPTGAEIYIGNCLVKGQGAAGLEGYGIIAAFVAAGSRTLKVWNTIISDIKNGADVDFHGVYVRDSWTAHVHNVTVKNCYYGYRNNGGTSTWKNCGADGCTTAFSGGAQTTCSPSTPTYLSGFSLSGADTEWLAQGTDLSGDSIGFSTDINGATRPATWSIGADDIPAAGGTGVWVLVRP